MEKPIDQLAVTRHNGEPTTLAKELGLILDQFDDSFPAIPPRNTVLELREAPFMPWCERERNCYNILN
jgi:hypothetical protein